MNCSSIWWATTKLVARKNWEWLRRVWMVSFRDFCQLIPFSSVTFCLTVLPLKAWRHLWTAPYKSNSICVAKQALLHCTSSNRNSMLPQKCTKVSFAGRKTIREQFGRLFYLFYLSKQKTEHFLRSHSVDSLLQIHALHNLLEINEFISVPSEEVAEYTKELEGLEWKYLKDSIELVRIIVIVLMGGASSSVKSAFWFLRWKLKGIVRKKSKKTSFSVRTKPMTTNSIGGRNFCCTRPISRNWNS